MTDMTDTEYWEDRIADLTPDNAEVLPNLILEMRTNRHPVAVHYLAETVLARIVPPDHDLTVLRDVTGGKDRERLLRVAEWTGETTLAGIRLATSALLKARVDLDYPGWEGQLPPGPHDVDDLVVRDRLGREGQVMLDSGHDPQDWIAAIEEIRDETYSGGQDYRQARRIAARAAQDGLDPRQTVARAAELRESGVGFTDLHEAFGSEALPVDLLTRYSGSRLREHCAEAAKHGLDTPQLFELLRAGMTAEAVMEHLTCSVRDPTEILALHTAGVGHQLLARARNEHLPFERWPAVLPQLTALTYRDQWGTERTPLARLYGLFQLEELLDIGGRPIPGRVAWDGSGSLRLPQSLPLAGRRALADRDVDPDLFCTVLARLLGTVGTGGTKYNQAGAQEIEQAAQAVEAGVTKELLDRLTYALGWSNNSPSENRHDLRVTAEQLVTLAGLAPTGGEARHLGFTVRSDTDKWITTLRAWRTHHEAALAEYARLRADRHAGPFLAWLAKAGSTAVFTTKSRPRTEAVEVIAAGSRAHDPGLVHAEILHHALTFNLRETARTGTVLRGIPAQHMVGLGVTTDALERLKRTAHRL